MLTKKQQDFFNFIIECYNQNKEIPTIGSLKKNSKYKSYNTIYKYLNILEKKNYIKLNKEKKNIIYIKEQLINNDFITIPIINNKQNIKLSHDLFDLKKEYLAYRINNNKLNSYYIKNKDILIIEKSHANLNNKLVLVLIDNKYNVFLYIKKDGFIHLKNDKQLIILTSFKIIVGKVVSIIRDTMD